METLKTDTHYIFAGCGCSVRRGPLADGTFGLVHPTNDCPESDNCYAMPTVDVAAIPAMTSKAVSTSGGLK